MKNERFNPVPKQESLSEAYSLVLSSALEMIYDVLRLSEGTRNDFERSLAATLQGIESSEVSGDFRDQSIRELMSILEDSTSDQKDLNAAKSYIEHLIMSL